MTIERIGGPMSIGTDLEAISDPETHLPILTTRVPDTIEEARGQLTGLAKIGTAIDWVRAAIVYAFTRDEQRGGDRRSAAIIGKSANGLAAYEFAALKIPGLTSHHTVLAYRQGWQWAMEQGASAAVPGEPIPASPVSWDAWREEISRRKRERDWDIEEDVTLPAGRYSILYADPPWPTAGGSKENYPTISIDAIADFEDAEGRPVDDLPRRDAVLFLWAVNQYLPDALKVMKAWGFDYVGNLVWDKQMRMGLGRLVKQRHELLLFGTRGSWPDPVDPKTRIDSVLSVVKRRHSQKPEEVYDWIEAMYPKARKVELFARDAREGWDVFGNQAPTDADE